MAWAEATGADLKELLNLAQRAKSGTPEWFMPYLGAEQAATRLWFWEPLLIPGPLQTEAYARALFSARPRTAEQVAAMVTTRLERRKVIGRAQITAAIDYMVLLRPIGSPAVMAEQCSHVGRLIEDQQISLHVVPEGANVVVAGAFAIATRDGISTVSLTTSSRDITSTALDVVDENMNLSSTILGASLPAVPSLEFIRTQEETWKERS